MKKATSITSFIAIILLMFLFLSGCNKTSKSANVYIEMAQDFIDEGDYDSAVEVLQKGFDTTGDDEIAAMLLETIAMQLEQGGNNTTPQPSTPSQSNTEYDVYVGLWADEAISWLYGGFIMDISISNETMHFMCAYTQSAPGFRVANINTSIALSKIENNIAAVDFEDDGWGNAGTLILEFMDGMIDCRIQNVHYVGSDAFAIWGVPDDSWLCLFKNDNAFDRLNEYTMEEYYLVYPEEDPNQQYDTSKASGILAAAGLTEQQFRDICTPISRKYSVYYNYSATPEAYRIDRYHLSYGIEYYSTHPEETAVSDAISRWDDICSDYQSGGSEYKRSYGYGMSSRYHLYTKYTSAENYLYDTVYAPKGEDILLEASEEIFSQMKEYPNEFIGTPYVLIGFDLEPSNSYVYMDDGYINTEVTIYDLRDDVHNPNVMARTDYYLYVIFEGTYVDYDGDIGLIFSLLSLEKCE